MRKPTKETYTIAICSLVVGYFLPEFFLCKENINYLTGFMSFYSAGIFPTAMLLINNFGSLDTKNTSKDDLNKEVDYMNEVLYNCYFIFLSIMAFIFTIFVYSCVPKELILLRHAIRTIIIFPFLLASYGSVRWLPRIIMKFVTNKINMKKNEISDYYDKAMYGE